CHYCTFVAAPADVPAPFMSPDEVLAIASAGAARQCKEALFTMGDRPEDRWPQAGEWLAAAGYASTLDYLRAMAVLVLEETGLLPHLNPGVMTWHELMRLKPVAPSMGMMLETTSDRLWSTPGAPHYGSPDKEPAVRREVLENAGRLSIPFTTGILIGIGETLYERAESVLAIRSAHRAHGHVQEVIVQNFRAKPKTAMADAADSDEGDLLATLATARVLLGTGMRVQVPPNLSDTAVLPRLVAAGIDDWGGVSPLTPDHVNPERPWPQVTKLAEATRDAGYTLRERLTVHPSYVHRGERWIDPRVQPHVDALAEPSGLARQGDSPTGLPWQEPGQLADGGCVDLHREVDAVGRSSTGRTDAEHAFGSWSVVAAAASAVPTTPVAKTGLPAIDADVRDALRVAERDPAALLQPENQGAALAVLTARGADLDAVASLADAVRQDVVGDDVTFVVNRNINFTNICYTGCRFCAFAQRRSDADAYELSIEEVVRRATEAWDLGATEVCLQGGIDPQLPATHYVDLVSALCQALPELHVHAFSPMEVASGAARAGVSIADFLAELADAGLGSLPGTAAEILDDEVRWVLTKGKLPTAAWVDVVQNAHLLGLRTSSTMMFGHVDRPDHWLTHLRVLAMVQDHAVAHGAQGFTEFVPLPFVHQSAPLYLAGIGRPGPSRDESRVVHAAARLLLHGRVDHVQVSWVKLGGAGAQVMLRSGADDLGGTLMEETISRMAGSAHGSAMTVAELAGWASDIERPSRQRTTTYGGVSQERSERSSQTGGVLRRVAATR
ncbi:MAG: bifunctional FO biosynthesis protein CofGH, partial [Actinomycetes bacterium]